MIGIYQDDFVDYLKEKLGERVKTTSKNIICPCPFCEYGKDKNHYHMYISLEAPIFHCFKGNCEESGMINKFIRKIEGSDISEQFIDKEALRDFSKNKEIFKNENDEHKLIIPPLNSDRFKLKEMYIKKRLKFFNINLNFINGLIFDVEEFLKINRIVIDSTLERIKDYLHTNFVGFVTEYGSTVIFRNIDNFQHMRYYKLKLNNKQFLDYYKLPGNNPTSNNIVLTEGIFDIFVEKLFDSIDIKNDVKLYASALSSKYIALIESIIFHEQIFKPNIIILSDKDIKMKYYENMKKYNPIIDSLTIYYNKTGKDFADSLITPVKFVI